MQAMAITGNSHQRPHADAEFKKHMASSFPDLSTSDPVFVR